MILLDTCVISEFARPAPDPAVLAWMECADEDSLRLSVLTLGEMKEGADLLDPGPAGSGNSGRWFPETLAGSEPGVRVVSTGM